MEKSPTNFEINLGESKASVQQHSVGGQVIFRVQFSNNRPPLVLHRAVNANESRFWTSIPEGRQREAEEIGKLISAHFKSRT
ncbi:MAG: hypothetical protein H7Y42_11610 [Chitinophagaceae bacterium]|nr:hypothetical protein [Chitinophagaceae bacterium]